MGELYKLFFFSPFMAFYNGLKLISRPQSKTFLILFFGFFGFTMIFPEGTDGFRHSQNIINHYDSLTFNDFFKELILLFQFIPSPGTNDDPYLHILSFISAIFNSSKVLYFIASFFYGFFYINSLYYVRSLLKSKLNFYLVLLFLSLIFLKGFEGINSIRNWTGHWCLFYVVIKYIVKRDKKILFLLLLPPFIHFGYMIISIPVIVGVFLSKYRKVFLIIYFLSFLISNLNFLDLASNYLKEGLFKDKTEIYYQDYEEIEEKQNMKNLSFHKKYAYDSFSYYIHCFFIFILLFSNKSLKKILENKMLFILSSSGLLLLSLSNITELIPSLSKRLYMNANLYMITFIILAYANILEYNTKLKLSLEFLIKLGIPIYLLFFFMQISYILEFTNIITIFPLPIGLFFWNDDISLKILLKDMFSIFY